MSDNKGKGSVGSQILVAVVIALLVGGSAPWWWKEVFPPRQPPTTLQQPPTIPQQPPTTLPPSGGNSGEPAPTGCVVTIANTLVALMSEPSRFSQQLVKVRPGEYTMLEYKVVKFGSQDQGWFQIEAEGRKGWIADDTWTIDSKTSTCP
jgi:hypothetical protein